MCTRLIVCALVILLSIPATGGDWDRECLYEYGQCCTVLTSSCGMFYGNVDVVECTERPCAKITLFDDDIEGMLEDFEDDHFEDLFDAMEELQGGEWEVFRCNSEAFQISNPSGIVGHCQSLPDGYHVSLVPNLIQNVPSNEDIDDDNGGPYAITEAELLANAPDLQDLVVENVMIASGNGTLEELGDGAWEYTPVEDDYSFVVFTFTISNGIESIAGAATVDLVPSVDDVPGLDDIAPPPRTGTAGCQIWDMVECAVVASCRGCKLVGDQYMCEETDHNTLHAEEFVSESPNSDAICGEMESTETLFPEYFDSEFLEEDTPENEELDTPPLP